MSWVSHTGHSKMPSQAGGGVAVSRKAVEALLNEISAVAVLPEVSLQIIHTLNDPDTVLGDFHRIFEQDAALAGEQGALLWAVSAENGQKLAEYTLDSLPVFDSLIAAGGHLYMTTTDGEVLCFGENP